MAQKLSSYYKSIKTEPMKDLKKQYEKAKNKAFKFMSNGQLHAYFDALVEMNHYKKLMFQIQAN